MAREDNLTPFVEGEERARVAGAIGGRGKLGTKHLSTLVKEIGDNIDWDRTNLKNKADVKQKYGKNGWKAVVYVAFTKAISGDIKAMEWLRKSGYGDKLDITTNDKDLFSMDILKIEIVKSDNEDTTERKTEDGA